MGTPAALLSALELLCASIDQEPVFLIKPLAELARELDQAVHDYVGIEVTLLTQLGQPITLSDFAPDADLSAIATSLRLPLTALTKGGSDGHVTFFGARNGAFVDLAADLSFALRSGRSNGNGPTVHLSLDEHLRPANVQAALVGADEESAINRAIGLLIGRGRTPDEAEAELVLRAREAGTSVAAFAVESLRRAEPPI